MCARPNASLPHAALACIPECLLGEEATGGIQNLIYYWQGHKVSESVKVVPPSRCVTASSGTEKKAAAFGTCCNSILCHAGDHIRQSMLQVGSASEPVAYVEGILGKGHLQPIGCGYKPQIDSLLKELKIV